MLKSLAKLICPSSRSIAESAANSIQAGYNGIAIDKREKIAHYTSIAKKAAQYAERLDALAADGKIDDAERERIAAALEPLIESAKEIVFN